MRERHQAEEEDDSQSHQADFILGEERPILFEPFPGNTQADFPQRFLDLKSRISRCRGHGLTPSGVANARIQEGIGDIGHQVGQQRQRADEQERPHHQRNIARG